MNQLSLLLRIVALLALVGAFFLYIQSTGRQNRLEGNLAISRSILQNQLGENSQLESKVILAEREAVSALEQAEEERTKSVLYQKQYEDQKQLAIQAVSDVQAKADRHLRFEETIAKLQYQIREFQKDAAPNDWKNKVEHLRSRVLELEAQNSSLRNQLHNETPTTSVNETGSFTYSSPIESLLNTWLVSRVGPDGSFIILNYGRKFGATADQRMVISRNKMPVGRVIITQITNDFCVAQVISGTNSQSDQLSTGIQVGDLAKLDK